MNKIPLAAALLALSATTAAADCLGIKAYDLRQACLAQARQDPRDCTSIKGWDDREICRQRAGQTDMFGRRQDGLDARR
jgi:hypothetical protein